MTFRIDLPCSQEAFASLVGITPARVSQLVADGTLPRDGTAALWLMAYCERLRSVAAGRDSDGALSVGRARVARATAEKIEMQNTVTRREIAPVAALELVLSDVTERISTRLGALVPQIRSTAPDLPAAVLTRITADVDECREDCARVTMADADKLDDDDLPDDPGPERDDPSPESVPAGRR